MTLRQVRARHTGYVIGDLGETDRFARGARRSLHREGECDDECNDARQPVHVCFTIAVATSVGNGPRACGDHPERPAHVTSSVGWLGAVVVFVSLAVVGLTSQDAQTVRGAYRDGAGRLVRPRPVGLRFAADRPCHVAGATWGLFRHYWVVFKLLITAFATIILLIYMGTLRFMAGLAADPTADLGAVRNPSPAVHAVLALLVLFAATVLAVYKPQGLTPYGRRRPRGQRTQ